MRGRNRNREKQRYSEKETLRERQSLDILGEREKQRDIMT
jgi:hypothetical protein